MPNNSEIDGLINLFSKLPSIGKRSATRIVLHLIKSKKDVLHQIADQLKSVANKIIQCDICGNIDESSPCSICKDEKRSNNKLCIVEGIEDLWALEKNSVFAGKYHILGGALSALKGISPDDLNLENLSKRIVSENFEEVIIATNPTVDGQTTAFYIMDLLQEHGIKITKLANGIPLGSELDYLDEGTLKAAFSSRSIFE